MNESEVICRKCNYKLKEEWKICPKCHNLTASNKIIKEPVETRIKKSKQQMMGALLMIICIPLLLIGIYQKQLFILKYNIQAEAIIKNVSKVRINNTKTRRGFNGHHYVEDASYWKETYTLEYIVNEVSYTSTLILIDSKQNYEIGNQILINCNKDNYLDILKDNTSYVTLIIFLFLNVLGIYLIRAGKKTTISKDK